MLEFLPELFDALREEAYALTESEAAIFLPCLIEKVLEFSIARISCISGCQLLLF